MVRTGNAQRRFRIVVPLVAGLAVPCGAAAQDYPTKAIRWVVPYPPGGSSDFLARVIGQKITDAWKQTVVVDNRTGANGNIGTEAAARAPADGYTLLLVASTFTMNPGLYPNLPFDTEKDLTPVITILYQPYILSTHPTLPVRSVQQLLALARAKPGGLDYASGGAGNATHIAAELFSTMAGIRMNHIPYRGVGIAITSLLSGETQLTFAPLVAVQPHLNTGRLRALGVTSRKRVATLPDMPTVAESGVPGYEEGNWQAVLVPTGTTRGVVTKLNQELVRILTTTDVKDQIAKIGADVIANTPEQTAALIRTDLKRYGDLIRKLGIRVE